MNKRILQKSIKKKRNKYVPGVPWAPDGPMEPIGHVKHPDDCTWADTS